MLTLVVVSFLPGVSSGQDIPAFWGVASGTWDEADKWSTAPTIPMNDEDMTFDVTLGSGTEILVLSRAVEIGSLFVGTVVPLGDGDVARDGNLEIVTGGSLVTDAAVISLSDLDGIWRRGSGNGRITVSGHDASWRNSGTISVGRGSHGTLKILDGAQVASAGVNIGVRQGFIFVDHGSGAVTVDGDGSRLTTNTLRVGSTRSDAGSLTVSDGGEVIVQSDLTVYSHDSIYLRDGSIASPNVILSAGKISGAGTILGSVASEGGILSATDITISESLKLDPMSRFVFDPASSSGGMGGLRVGGDASLDGAFDVKATGSLPTPGNHTVQALGSENIGGMFATIVPSVFESGGTSGHVGAGVFFKSISYVGSTVMVDLYQAVPGDTNNDGTVDFEDFLVVSGNFNMESNWLTGDFDSNGVTDFRDFLLLSGNAVATGAIAQIPEPSTFSQMLFAACFVALVRSRRSGPQPRRSQME